MKFYLIFLTLFLLMNVGYSQTIEMQVISSTGSSVNGQLEYTLGEAVIAGNTNLTQGFHQGRLIITAIENIIEDIEVIAYPNPTMQGVNIKTDDIPSVKIRLLDIQGRQLLTASTDQFPFYLDLNRYKSGIYFIQLYDKKQLLKTFKIEKIK